jgi:hypothetical protein
VDGIAAALQNHAAEIVGLLCPCALCSRTMREALQD